MKTQPVKMSKWHIDEGVVGKHHGRSYCENCDYVPLHIEIFDPVFLEYRRGPQSLSPYCPRCGSYMVNFNKDWES